MLRPPLLANEPTPVAIGHISPPCFRSHLALPGGHIPFAPAARRGRPRSSIAAMEPDSARSPSPSPPSSPASPDREDAPLVIDIADEEMSAPECGSASSEDYAVTPDVLRLREELEALQRELRREVIARVSGTPPPLPPGRGINLPQHGVWS